MADLEADFDSGISGASETYPQQCSALRKNGHVMIKKRPCKIVEMSTSKTGKHGHAKVHLVGLDIFTGKKYDDICPSTHNMNVPHVSRKDYQLTNVEDDDPLIFNLMDDAGECTDHQETHDSDLLREIRARFKTGETFLVTILKACGEERIVTTKVLN